MDYYTADDDDDELKMDVWMLGQLNSVMLLVLSTCSSVNTPHLHLSRSILNVRGTDMRTMVLKRKLNTIPNALFCACPSFCTSLSDEKRQPTDLWYIAFIISLFESKFYSSCAIFYSSCAIL